MISDQDAFSLGVIFDVYFFTKRLERLGRLEIGLVRRPRTVIRCPPSAKINFRFRGERTDFIYAISHVP